MDDGRKTSASAIRRSALPRFAACLAVVGCAPRGAGATCVSPGTSRCAAWNAAGVGDYDYECPSTAVLELFSASSAIFLLDPYTQAADDGCMYDWSGRGHHAGLSDVNVPGETAVAPAVTSETLTSGVAAAYYRFDGETNYAPLAGPTYSTVGELTDFTFVAWVWTDHYSVTASDDSNWAIVDFDRSEYVELACCFLPLARCRRGVAQWAAGVKLCACQVLERLHHGRRLHEVLVGPRRPSDLRHGRDDDQGLDVAVRRAYLAHDRRHVRRLRGRGVRGRGGRQVDLARRRALERRRGLRRDRHRRRAALRLPGRRLRVDGVQRRPQRGRSPSTASSLDSYSSLLSGGVLTAFDSYSSLLRGGVLTARCNAVDVDGKLILPVTRRCERGDVLTARCNEVYFDGKLGVLGYWDFEMGAADMAALYDATKKFYQVEKKNGSNERDAVCRMRSGA